MKKTSLFIAAMALLSFAACQKIDTPEVPQEEPEVAAEEPVVATEPEQTLTAEAVAATLDDVIEKNQVKLFVNNLMVMIGEADDTRHFEFDVAVVNEDETHSYLCGTLGLEVGEYHPIVIDMNLMALEALSIVGQLDMVQIAKYRTRAALSIDNFTCDFNLQKASEGFGILLGGKLKLCLLRGEDENGKRTIGLYLYDPEDPEIAPIPVPKLSKMFLG